MNALRSMLVSACPALMQAHAAARSLPCCSVGHRHLADETTEPPESAVSLEGSEFPGILKYFNESDAGLANRGALLLGCLEGLQGGQSFCPCCKRHSAAILAPALPVIDCNISSVLPLQELLQDRSHVTTHSRKRMPSGCVML